MQVEEFTLNIENDKKIYTVWYYEKDGIILQIDHFYFSDRTTEEVIYAIEDAFEEKDRLYGIEEINLEILEQIWTKYRKWYDENF